MPSPKWLLLAPPCVWAAVGAIALVAPGELLNLFPLLWPLHDASLILATAGAIWWLFGGLSPEPVSADPWEPADAELAADENAPLDLLLGRLARRLEIEARGLT